MKKFQLFDHLFWAVVLKGTRSRRTQVDYANPFVHRVKQGQKHRQSSVTFVWVGAAMRWAGAVLWMGKGYNAKISLFWPICVIQSFTFQCATDCCRRLLRVNQDTSAQQVVRAIRAFSAKQSGRGPRTRQTSRDAKLFQQVLRGEKMRT